MFVAALLALGSTPAQAGFLWAQVTCSNGSCGYSSAEGGITAHASVAEIEGWTWRVSLRGLGSEATQALYAQSTQALTTCTIAQAGWRWDVPDQFDVFVQCHDRSGRKRFSVPFVLAFRGEALPGEQTAWVRADQPDNSWYVVPDGEFAYNPGGTTTIQRTGTGDYSVELKGMPTEGVAYVTPATDGPHKCTVTETSPTADGVSIGLTCADIFGAQADVPFYLTYVHHATFTSSATADVDAGMHLWADLPWWPEAYVPREAYQWNGRVPGTTAAVKRLGVGAYLVDTPGFTANNGLALVQAYGWSGEVCAPTWNPRDGVSTQVVVDCWIGTERVDATFAFSYQEAF